MFPQTRQKATAKTDETGYWRFCHYATGVFLVKTLAPGRDISGGQDA